MIKMIEIKNVSKTYNGEKKALNDISFDINNGEIMIEGNVEASV